MNLNSVQYNFRRLINHLKNIFAKYANDRQYQRDFKPPPDIFFGKTVPPQFLISLLICLQIHVIFFYQQTGPRELNSGFTR